MKALIIALYLLIAVPGGVMASLALSGCGNLIPINMKYNEVLIEFVDVPAGHQPGRDPCLRGYTTVRPPRPGERFARARVVTMPPEDWNDDAKIYTLGHEVVHARGGKHPPDFTIPGTC